MLGRKSKLTDSEKDQPEDQQTNQQTQTTTIHVLIYLPRDYHLLLKLHVEDNQTLISIKTDYWRVLTYVDSFLEDILKK